MWNYSPVIEISYRKIGHLRRLVVVLLSETAVRLCFYCSFGGLKFALHGYTCLQIVFNVTNISTPASCTSCATHKCVDFTRFRSRHKPRDVVCVFYLRNVYNTCNVSHCATLHCTHRPPPPAHPQFSHTGITNTTRIHRPDTLVLNIPQR